MKKKQQNDPYAQQRLGSVRASAQSDQSSLCTQWVATQDVFMPTAKTLIRLGGCPGGSESSMATQVILLVLSCGGSYVIIRCAGYKILM